MRPRAFIVEPAKLDPYKAKAFGDLTYIFVQEESRPSVFDPTFQRDVIDRLCDHNFRPETDYIIVLGSMTTIAIALSAVAAEYGDLRLLVFDANEQNYVVVSSQERS